ncbi:MAG: TM2 domain-containing protein [Succiniclasticum sp.]|uniref:TM2 domain-containing protein n=1 Tax=Succiniclasticum sp. TaxID=2775030 RepID=UPI002A913DCD|nr:TM2 domain-containing protein [Succiniclasticum sp.]MDY6290474.1 TM2 domain-containing protein [Succiniclasticum sp.]
MAMKKCSSCGEQFEGDMKFCVMCGGKLEELETIVDKNTEAPVREVEQQYVARTKNEVPLVNGGARSGKGRVIKLDGKTATLGMQDGTILEILCADLGFKVSLNDEIEIFTSNGKTVYTKAVTKDNVVVVTPDKNTNKLIYFLLAFFLGGAGIHNFYSGNTAVGIIWLIVFGICFLLSLTGIGAFIGGPVIFLLWVIAIIQAIIYALR